MRVFRYTSNRGGLQPRLAVAAPGSRPVDLVDAWLGIEGNPIDPDVQPWLTSTASLIEQGPGLWADVEGLCEQATGNPGLEVQDADWEVRWLSPLDRLASLRDFLSFESHVKMGARRRGGEVPPYWYEAPVYYKGNHRAVLGPDETCPWPSYTSHLDFELELAMIVGVKGRDIDPEAAAGHIFGFTVMNDFSARDIQAREMTAWLGPAKGKDFATALGPCIVTASEVGPQPDLAMSCRVNGEEWGRARSSEMHWTWGQMLSHVSRDEDVYPGDVYGSGTPGGCCGLDTGRAMKPGDTVELDIERIGTLFNTVSRKPVID